jgi:hypothetical protein
MIANCLLENCMFSFPATEALEAPTAGNQTFVNAAYAPSFTYIVGWMDVTRTKCGARGRPISWRTSPGGSLSGIQQVLIYDPEYGNSDRGPAIN